MRPSAIRRWHEVVEKRSPALLDTLLADEVIFHSPVLHTPQRGKRIVTMYLIAATQVLGGEKFRYVGEWIGERSAVLEFVTEIEGLEINGVDIVAWNADDRIVTFKVMIRPLKAINALHQAMAARLATA